MSAVLPRGPRLVYKRPAAALFNFDGAWNMRVVPLGDKIAVKRLDAEETTAGGIVLPDAAKEKPQQGRVLSVGEGRLLPDGNRALRYRGTRDAGDGAQSLRGLS